MKRLILILRDFGIFSPKVSTTAARRILFEQSSDMQRPAPKKIPVEMVKEGAD